MANHMTDLQPELTNALALALNQPLAAEEESERLDAEADRAAYDLLMVQGLYAEAATDTPLGEIIETKLRHGNFAFDAYCVGCKRETVFRIASKQIVGRGANSRLSVQDVVPPPILAVHATCQRDFTVYTCVIQVSAKRITKIGQWPSMADLAFGELKTIDRSLDPVDRKELGTALGLISHDAAIGAFAYLRRVFERMIERAHDRKAKAGTSVEGFPALPMDKKVAALVGELPDIAVRNSGVFSVLSLGLHELTEEQCTKHFPVIKAVLFQMLEQEEHKRKAAITSRETEAALQGILSDLGSRAVK